MASFAEIHKNTTVTSYSSICTTFKEADNDQKQTDILKTEYRRYIRNKILFHCLRDCTQNLGSELGDKVDSAINDIILDQYKTLGNKHLLGISLSKKMLTYHEGEKLKMVLQNKIYEKRCKLFEEFKKISLKDLGQVIKIFKCRVLAYDMKLPEKGETVVEYKNKLVKEQEILLKNVSSRSNLLEEILDLRLKKVPTMCVQANRECKAKIESYYLKSKIVEHKTKIDIFMEFPRAIEAYLELLKDIKHQQEECELSIEDLRENKIKYENVSGREYDEILKSYLMYKNSIDKLNKMYAFVR